MTIEIAHSESVEEILEAIKQINVMELVQLVEDLEEEFGVSAAVPMLIPDGASGPAYEVTEPIVEVSYFNLILTDFGETKVPVIKEVRTITSLGLKESKDLVEAIPAIILSSVLEEEAKEAAAVLEAAGATVDIQPV